MSDGQGLAPASAQEATPVAPEAAAKPTQLSLEEALRREQKKIALVQEISRALSQAGDLDTLLALIMAKVQELMEADRSTLYLLTDDGRYLWSKVVQGGERVEIRLEVGDGIAGWVAQTHEIVNIPDAYADQRFQPSVDLKSGYRTRSILAVPMRGALGGLVGVLQVLNKQDGPFTTPDEELLVALASQAAIAIDNARLYHSLLAQNQELSRARRDLERRTRELNALYEVEKELSAALDLDDLLSRILAQAINVLGGGAGSIALSEPGGELRFRTVQGPAAPKLIERTLPYGTGLLGWAIAHRSPLIVDDPQSDPRHAADVAKESGVSPQHLMIAPLVEGDDVIGGIEIIDQRRAARDGDGPWGDDDLKLLVLIAAQTASAIGMARRRSEQSNRDRLASIGLMLGGLLHDLKTPMTIISGYAQLMASSDDAAQREKYVEQIQRQFDLMAGMTREVLAFARGDSDLVIRKVYVNRFAEEIATQLGAAVAGRGIEFEVEARYDGVAFFDEQKLMRVFHNLTSNAIEAMPDGGHLRVRIDREGDDLVWTVTDTGQGIPAAVHARMFELFATGRKGGTGLGLAIVKRVVDDHKGTIRCDTGPAGTAFTIRMPAMRTTDTD
ncbi:MAG: GAF domain-containing protein [Deltaproteobacteria bacterium]|nr:GAF domain-containing protein [Deltaproteobacteria bacterium]MDQ3300673.1 GAF domain-containing protein [Myxococcota bacterium]